VRRIFLILILALGAASYFPRSRAVLRNFIAPVVDPLLRQQSLQEMQRIASELGLRERENVNGLPEPRAFETWLSSRVPGSLHRDAWSGAYALVVTSDSFFVTSPGPDGAAGTEDDLRVARARAFRSR
jgi:hypothetical protein